MEKPNSTFILNCQSCSVNNYLEKCLFIIENNYKQLSILSNDVKLIINAIEQLEPGFVMAKNRAIYSVANTKNKLHIQYDLHLIYKTSIVIHMMKSLPFLINIMFPY